MTGECPDEGAEGGGDSWDALVRVVERRGQDALADTGGGALLGHEAPTGFPALPSLVLVSALPRVSHVTVGKLLSGCREAKSFL